VAVPGDNDDQASDGVKSRKSDRNTETNDVAHDTSRPELTEEEYLWEVMDQTPETIFQAIDAITMKGPSSVRLEAYKKAVKALLQLIAHRETTGHWGTHYDIDAVKAWDNGELPTKVHTGPKLASQEDAAFDTLGRSIKIAEYRRRQRGEPMMSTFFGDETPDIDLTDDEEWIAEAIRSSKYPRIKAYPQSEQWPDIPYMWQVWKAEQHERSKRKGVKKRR
jgi:hypothetical protein